jgi:hypothetical protein
LHLFLYLSQRGEYVCRDHRDLAHSHPCGIVERIADCRGQRDDAGRLTGAGGVCRTPRDVVLDQRDLYLGHLARAQDLLGLQDPRSTYSRRCDP